MDAHLQIKVSSKHQRTKSDLLAPPKPQEATEKTSGHTRKKSHQDYLLKLESEMPSHIKQNIKNLIATRMHSDG